MRRWLFNLAAALSVVLFVVAVLLWVLSYSRRYDVSCVIPPDRAHDLCFYRGGCYVWKAASVRTDRWHFYYYTLPAEPHPELDLRATPARCPECGASHEGKVPA